jgi:hypothetical protein
MPEQAFTPPDIAELNLIRAFRERMDSFAAGFAALELAGALAGCGGALGDNMNGEAPAPASSSSQERADDTTIECAGGSARAHHSDSLTLMVSSHAAATLTDLDATNGLGFGADGINGYSAAASRPRNKRGDSIPTERLVVLTKGGRTVRCIITGSSDKHNNINLSSKSI